MPLDFSDLDDDNKLGRYKNMTTIGEDAKAYEPQRLKNIADLDAVSIQQEIKSEIRKNKEGEEYHVKYIVIGGEEYRVPVSVSEQLQTMLKEKPLMKTFKVSKKGEGFNTTYTVIPLE